MHTDRALKRVAVFVTCRTWGRVPGLKGEQGYEDVRFFPSATQPVCPFFSAFSYSDEGYANSRHGIPVLSRDCKRGFGM